MSWHNIIFCIASVLLVLGARNAWNSYAIWKILPSRRYEARVCFATFLAILGCLVLSLHAINF